MIRPAQNSHNKVKHVLCHEPGLGMGTETVACPLTEYDEMTKNFVISNEKEQELRVVLVIIS